MRILFLLLVLANLGFAAWHNWYAPQPVPTRDLDAPGKSIVLVSELASGSGADSTASRPSLPSAREPARNGPSDAAEPGASDAGTRQSCLSVGPFMSEDAATAAATVLEAAGVMSAVRAEQGEIWLGNWVYIDGIETQARANEIAQIFHDAGVPEAYVIANPDNNLVSLGVFAERSRALQRRDQAVALDFDAVIADWTRSGTVYRLEITGESSASADWQSLLESDSPVPLEANDCTAAAPL